MSDPHVQINLKAIRAQAGISLTRAAELTSVSKAMLGQIERGESSPTITVLWKIAKGFHVPLTALIGNIAHSADQDIHSNVSFPDSISVQTVFPFDPDFCTETFVVSLHPGQSHISIPHDTGVIEDIYVLTGDIEIMQNDTWAPYNQGDALRFKADQPHGYRNLGARICQFHNIIYYPAKVTSVKQDN